MRIKSYTDALRIANAAGMDAANRRMRKAGRTVWSLEDRNHCCDVVENILVALGYDVRSWAALAGLPRNEPEEPAKPKRAKAKRSARRTKEQLNFGFG